MSRVITVDRIIFTDDNVFRELESNSDFAKTIFTS